MKLNIFLTIAFISAIIGFTGMVGVTKAQANYYGYDHYQNHDYDNHKHDHNKDHNQQLSVTPAPTETPSVSPAPSTAPVADSSNSGSGTQGTPPTFQGSTTLAPVCSATDTTQQVANPFVQRSGTQAIVNFFITQGNSANIYYKESSAVNWEFSVPDLSPNGDNFVSYTINDLKSQVAYDFGIQQKFDCGGGLIITAPVLGK